MPQAGDRDRRRCAAGNGLRRSASRRTSSVKHRSAELTVTLRILNQDGQSAIPNNAPREFVPPLWRPYLFDFHLLSTATGDEGRKARVTPPLGGVALPTTTDPSAEI
jgi:hypothetical protein